MPRQRLILIGQVFQVILLVIAGLSIWRHATWLVIFASSYGVEGPDIPLGMVGPLINFQQWSHALVVAGTLVCLAATILRFRYLPLLIGAWGAVYGGLFLYVRTEVESVPIGGRGFFVVLASLAAAFLLATTESYLQAMRGPSEDRSS